MLLSWWLLKGPFLSSFFCQTDRTLTPSLRLCLCSSCAPQLGHDPCRSFCFVPLRKAADASIMMADKKVGFISFSSTFQKGRLTLTPSLRLCLALHVFHSLTTIPAAVSALSRWERQLMLLSWWQLKGRYSFFFILSTRLDTDTFPPSLFVLSMCSTAWPRSLLLFLLCPVEKGSWCFYVGICSKVGILSFLFCQLDWTLTPSLRLCVGSSCVPQLGHDPCRSFFFAPLRKATDASIMMAAQRSVSFFFFLSTRLDTDSFPPPLFGSPCVPQLGRYLCCCFSFVLLRKAADASIMMAAQR